MKALEPNRPGCSEAIISVVHASGLRGRCGAGFGPNRSEMADRGRLAFISRSWSTPRRVSRGRPRTKRYCERTGCARVALIAATSVKQ